MLLLFCLGLRTRSYPTQHSFNAFNPRSVGILRRLLTLPLVLFTSLHNALLQSRVGTTAMGASDCRVNDRLVISRRGLILLHAWWAAL